MTTHTTVTLGDVLADITPLEMAGALMLATNLDSERTGDYEAVESFEAELRDPDSVVGIPVRMFIRRIKDARELYGFEVDDIDRAINAFLYELTAARERVVRRFDGTPTYYND